MRFIGFTISCHQPVHLRLPFPHFPSLPLRFLLFPLNQATWALVYFLDFPGPFAERTSVKVGTYLSDLESRLHTSLPADQRSYATFYISALDDIINHS